MLMKTLYQKYLESTGITTDTRQIKDNMLFFALKGDNFNGNAFAKQALEKGAAYAIIDEVNYQENERYILVDDVLTCLQNLANYHRRQLSIPIIAITGTNGKTTTKELVSRVLATTFNIYYTQGNFNNHIGVPLTLLHIPTDAELAIIEMGANHIGEIAILCNIAEPTHGVITNIGKAHLEGFGSLEGVKQTKSELYRFLEKNKGTAFVNQNPKYLNELATGVSNIIKYGNRQHKNLDYSALFLEAEPYVKLIFSDSLGELVHVSTQLFGAYNFDNIITAIAIGLHFNVLPGKIKEALQEYKPSNNRSQIVKRGSQTFVLDAYNANPTSVRTAIDNFLVLNGDNKIVILGDMLELGPDSYEEHKHIAEYLATQNLKQVVLVGKEYQAVSQFIDALCFPSVKEAKIWFKQQQFNAKSYFLIKGSRGIRLEQLLN